MGQLQQEPGTALSVSSNLSDCWGALRCPSRVQHRSVAEPNWAGPTQPQLIAQVDNASFICIRRLGLISRTVECRIALEIETDARGPYLIDGNGRLCL